MGKVIVVGAGAAGLMAALFAARHGAEVVVIEKNARAGRKLALTGNGRGNITHWAEGDALIREIPGNGRFLYGALRRFGPEAVRELFDGLGVPTKVEGDGRVFPCSDRAGDIVQALVDEGSRLGVKWLWESRVKELILHEDKAVGVRMDNNTEVTGEAVILCTGGASYPQTGSAGDGYAIAAAVGHDLVTTLPTLVPLVSLEPWIASLQGVSLQDVEIRAMDPNCKTICETKGDMLFTHYGISGPAILRLSRGVVLALQKKTGPITVSVNLRSDLRGEEVLDREVQNQLSIHARKAVKNVLGVLLSEKLVTVILERTGIGGEKPAHQLSRVERQRLVGMIRDFQIKIEQSRPLAEATVTMGGISIKEIDPKTMGSRRIVGLFFAGEVTDVDGYTGGYNLQAAFSMGAVAGTAAAEYVTS